MLEQVSIKRSLLGGLCVEGIDLLPVLGAGRVLVDEVVDGRLLAFAGDEELVEEDAGEEGGDEELGSELRLGGNSQHAIESIEWREGGYRGRRASSCDARF